MFSPANVFQYMVLRKISAPYSFETSSSLQVATEAIKFHGHGEKNNRSFSQAKDTWSIGWMPLSEILCVPNILLIVVLAGIWTSLVSFHCDDMMYQNAQKVYRRKPGSQDMSYVDDFIHA